LTANKKAVKNRLAVAKGSVSKFREFAIAIVVAVKNAVAFTTATNVNRVVNSALRQLGTIVVGVATELVIKGPSIYAQLPNTSVTRFVNFKELGTVKIRVQTLQRIKDMHMFVQFYRKTTSV
jgi:hypothetical protein